MKLKINGLIDKPLWKNIKCCCVKGNIEKSYPLSDCVSCKCQAQEDSMPRESFKFTIDKGEITIREITIVRDKKMKVFWDG